VSTPTKATPTTAQVATKPGADLLKQVRQSGERGGNLGSTSLFVLNLLRKAGGAGMTRLQVQEAAEGRINSDKKCRDRLREAQAAGAKAGDLVMCCPVGGKQNVKSYTVYPKALADKIETETMTEIFAQATDFSFGGKVKGRFDKGAAE